MADQDPLQQMPGASPASPALRLANLDAWMAQHSWHPRLVPFVVYLVFLLLIEAGQQIHPATYPVLYLTQCALVLGLLWRYRRLLPELTLSFHWLALPVGALVAAAWIGLGLGMVKWFPGLLASQPQSFMDRMGPGLGWTSFILRLLGMSLVVPLFEELFIRSLLLRSFHRFRRTAIGAFQILQDLPVLGEWLMHTTLGRKSGKHPPVFGPEFEKTPLGALSLFGVAASTFVFMVHHQLRDWPGTIVCGVAYCLLLAATRRKGLGPVIWAHGITNALLWLYTLKTWDWQFL